MVRPGRSDAALPETWPGPRGCTTFSTDLGVRTQPGFVPVFRAGERRRDRAFLQARGCEGSGPLRARFEASAEFLRDEHPSGEVITGPGDVELGVLLGPTFHPRPDQELSLGLGWRTKLPNARDESELGTDETDVALALAATYVRPRTWVGLEGGLAILGNPLRYAAQDDVPFLEAGAGFGQGARREGWSPRIEAETGVRWGMGTSRNPARASALFGLSVGAPWHVAVEVAPGLTPAAPDVDLCLRLGWSARP